MHHALPNKSAHVSRFCLCTHVNTNCPFQSFLCHTVKKIQWSRVSFDLFSGLFLSNKLWLLISPLFSNRKKGNVIHLKVCPCMKCQSVTLKPDMTLALSVVPLINPTHTGSPVGLIKILQLNQLFNTSIWSDVSFWCKTPNFSELALYLTLSYIIISFYVPSLSRLPPFFLNCHDSNFSFRFILSPVWWVTRVRDSDSPW